MSALKSVDCTGAPSQAVLSLPASLPLGHPLARAMRRGRTLPTLGIPTIPHDRERPPGKEARSARTFACEDMRRIHARHAGFTRAFESQDMRSGWYPVGCNVIFKTCAPPLLRFSSAAAPRPRMGRCSGAGRCTHRLVAACAPPPPVWHNIYLLWAEENRSGVCMCMCDFHACCVHLCVCEMCVNVHVC